jgi:HAD-superfamily hydrolase, subfamily IIB
MIKLFASDLDGTLLNPHHVIDSKIVKTLEDVVEAGYSFSVATGRSMGGIKVNQELWDLPIYLIAMNGALILNKEREIIHIQPMDKDVVVDILTDFPNNFMEYSTENEVLMMVSKAEYLKSLDGHSENSLRKTFSAEEIERFLEHYTFDCSKDDILNHTILKINCREDDIGEYERIEKCIEKWENKVTNAPFEANYFEITDKSVNKATGIFQLLDICKLSKEEVAVFGDGGNDIEMLKAFPNSFAMENGIDDAKKVAKTVIKSNAEYGVLKTMVRIMEEQKR